MSFNYLNAFAELSLNDSNDLSPIIFKKNDGIEEVKKSEEDQPTVKQAKAKSVKKKASKSSNSAKSNSTDEKPVTPKKTPEAKSPIASSPKVLTPPPVKKRHKNWTAKDKRDIESAFFAYNPCNDNDWERVREALPVEWSVEEIKAQAKKMKLKPLASKIRTPKTTAIEKIRHLMPDGKLPQKGTIRREALEEEVMQQLFVNRNGNENVSGSTLDDSDDLLIREAMQEHALENYTTEAITKFVTPSKRTYFPTAISASRNRDSLIAIESVGDDFSIPDRGKMKYRLKFRAQQFNRNKGANSVKKVGCNTEIMDKDDDEDSDDSF